jgi:hypothetical protein
MCDWRRSAAPDSQAAHDAPIVGPRRYARAGAVMSMRAVGQMCECFLQASCKFRIGASDFAQQAGGCDPESSQQFDGVELPD